MIRQLTRSAGRSDFMPDLTAMMDILFILLVFFLLTAGTAFHKLELNLPATKSKTLPVASKSKTLLLEVKDSEYLLAKQPVADLEDLAEQLPKLMADNPGSKLIVAGDKAISLERFLEVLTFLRVKGIDAADILMTDKQN